MKIAPLKIKKEPGFFSDVDFSDENHLGPHEILKQRQQPASSESSLISGSDVSKKPDRNIESFSLSLEVTSSSVVENFDCPLCGLSLSNGDDLEQHIVVHAGEKVFDCRICGKMYNDAITFGRHIRHHTGDKPFKCPTCGKGFREKCSLTRHTRTHTGEKPFVCEICNKSFSDVGSYGRHKKTHMGSRAKVHTCPYDDCTKSFIDKSSLKRHMKTHSGERPYQCEICKKAFTESGSYKRHLRVHSGEKRFKCKSCGKAFTEKASMQRHQRNVCNWVGDECDPKTEQAEEEYPYSLDDFFKCMVGRDGGANIQGNDHMLNNNNCIADKFDPHCKMRETAYLKKGCTEFKGEGEDFCSLPPAGSNGDDSATQRSSSSRSSPTVQDSEAEESVFCPVAFAEPAGMPSQMYTSMRTLQVHMQPLQIIMETDPAKLKDQHLCFECGDVISDCEESDIPNGTSCGGSTDTSCADERKPRRCKMCCFQVSATPKGETSPTTFEEHQAGQSHTCTECGKVFGDSSKLKRHLKIHLGIRNFRCKTCGKAFIEACSLRRHETVHADVKPNVCQKCGKGFTESSGLKKHLLKCKNILKVQISKKVPTKLELPSAIKDDNLKDKSMSPPLLNGSNCEMTSAWHDEGDASTEKALPCNSTYLREHSDSVVYVCTQCGRSCEDSRSLHRHLLAHARQNSTHPSESTLDLKPVNKAYSCPFCSKMFISAQYLSQHMKNHGVDAAAPSSHSVVPSNSSASLSCLSFIANQPTDTNFEGCTKSSLGTRENIFGDMASSHKTSASAEFPQGAPCDVCGKTFADASSLKRHARLHSESQHSCENCGRTYPDQGGLTKHRQRGCISVPVNNHGMGDHLTTGRLKGTSYPCTQCNKIFTTKELLVSHEMAHRVPPSLRCTICRKSFSDAMSLHHHSIVHSGERPYPCDVCLKAFADSGSLAKHRMRGCYPASATSVDSSKLPCADCGKVFSDQTSFDQHMSSHRGVKPFSCSQCGKSFTEACSLKRHMRLHTGQNLCRCLHCGRTFLENSGLKKHLERRSCQREKKAVKSFLYPCTVCRKIFTKRYILFRHMKTHLGLRPYKCGQCEKTFTESSSLKRHCRQHTGERPYSCSGCNKTFTDAGVMKKHKQRCPFMVDEDSWHATSYYGAEQNTYVSEPYNSRCKGDASSFSNTTVSRSHLPLSASTSTTFPGQGPPQPFPRTGCWRCGKCVADVTELAQHKHAAHTGTWAFKCLGCWQRFTRLPYLRLHKRCHLSDGTSMNGKSRKA